MLRCAIVDFGQAASPTARSPATGSWPNSSSLSAPSVVTPTMARLALSHGVARDDLPVERRAQLGRATLRRVVHIMEAEPVPVAVGPLEVVHQAPQEVALHGHSVGHGPLELTEIVAQEHDAVGVIHLPVRGGNVRRRSTVLG